ncbi:unnamed protein product [Lactuca virosa]|uniref:Complex III subunit 9 n=1 Tax=Lactuca virosa TaxID=75947 RepID=A0AAU9PQJ3_9ASTR|nr:unnamed protein product [Lactuca virosa]
MSGTHALILVISKGFSKDIKLTYLQVVGPIKFLSYRSGTDPVRVHTKLPRTKGSVSNLRPAKTQTPNTISAPIPSTRGRDYTVAMSSAARRTGGLFEGLYKVLMRRNSVYVTFVIAGAFVGERAVDYGVHKLWENNNVGKRYEDISVLGQRPTE